MRSRLKLISFCVTMSHKPLSVENHKLWSIFHHWKHHSKSNVDNHNSTISSTVNKATTEMVQMVNRCGSPQSMIPWALWIAQGCLGQRRLLGTQRTLHKSIFHDMQKTSTATPTIVPHCTAVIATANNGGTHWMGTLVTVGPWGTSNSIGDKQSKTKMTIKHISMILGVLTCNDATNVPQILTLKCAIFDIPVDPKTFQIRGQMEVRLEHGTTISSRW